MSTRHHSALLLLLLLLCAPSCAEEEPAQSTDTSSADVSSDTTSDTSTADTTTADTTTADSAEVDAAEPTPCSSNVDCDAESFCDYTADFCGATGFMSGDGVCAPRPTVCEEGGAGVCACDGSTPINACEAQRGGVDVSRFGGCPDSQGDFDCGGLETCSSGQLCSIAFNDTPGPEFYANCAQLPEGCDASAPSCDCLEPNDFSTCNDSTGAIVVVYPGG